MNGSFCFLPSDHELDDLKPAHDNEKEHRRRTCAAPHHTFTVAQPYVFPGIWVEGDGQQVPVMQADPDAAEEWIDQEQRMDRKEWQQQHIGCLRSGHPS